MENMSILLIVATLTFAIGYPTEKVLDVQPDDFFGANSVDADPISSEQAEQYKQQLLQRQKITGDQKDSEDEKISEDQKISASIPQNETTEIEKEELPKLYTTTVPTEIPSVVNQTTTPQTTTTISTASTILPSTTTEKVIHGSVKPQRTPQSGGVLSRIIDDIFQIPITVLQSVARLLRNPFAPRRTPESLSTY